MNSRRVPFASLFAVALVLLAPNLSFSHEPLAVAQSAGAAVGACVQQLGGACLLVAADECAKLPGLWYGEGTFCDGSTPCSPLTGCPPVSTACCLSDGTCVVLLAELCVEASGTPTIVDVTPCFAVTCPQPCVGDLDYDGNVGINDFLLLLAAWGPNPGHPADVDGDDAVGINDLLALLAAWGPCPQRS